MHKNRFALAISMLALTACHANHYSTPRTLPRGHHAHVAALHAEPFPVMVYVGRVGLADRVDLGLHASVGFNKLDLKYNFLRTKYFDMAIDPAVSWGPDAFGREPEFMGHLPLMLGFNVSPRVTLMAQGGPTLGIFEEHSFGQYSAPQYLAVMATAGGAAQIRVLDWLYLQPEFSINYGVYDAVQGTLYWPNIGIGVGFGRQPQYDDLQEKSK